MKYPKQPSGIDKDRRAVAPYNFVPLPEKIITLRLQDLPDHNIYENEPPENALKSSDPKKVTGRYSGYWDCELTTESPIYIRAGRQPSENRDASPSEFFYLFDKEQPIIPGSTLRGMLRNLVEIVSYSKLSWVSDKELVYRAVGDITSHGQKYRDRLMRDDGNKYYTPLIQAGYMRKNKNNDEWTIQPAKAIDGTTYAHIPKRKLDNLCIDMCESKKEIYIQTSSYQYQPVKGGFIHVRYARVTKASVSPEKGLRKAVLACSGTIASKRTEVVVYEEDNTKRPLDLSDDIIIAYKDQLDQCPEQQNVILNASTASKKTDEEKEKYRKNGVLQEGYPVLYIYDDIKDKVIFFGHCRMFRLPYLQGPVSLVPRELREPQDIDLSEAIFGYTKEKDMPEGKARAYAGRVFISDAILEPNQTSLWLSPKKPIIPKILASPKPTCFQHYLVQTKPNKIQIGKYKDGAPKFTTHLSDYDANSPGETVIRGNKFYWHKGNITLEELKLKSEKPLGKSEIQPLRSGVKFKFKIHFENLSPIELGSLQWILDVAADENYRLKVGMGKPLGMGAIKIESSLKLIRRKTRYQKLFQDDGWAENVYENKKISQDLKAIFERFILKELGNTTARRLRELNRIQEFLTMLTWPGPDKESTRYMEIERPSPHAKKGKFNEYRERPVLPTPLEVYGHNANDVKEDVKISDHQIPEGFKTGEVIEFGLGPNKSFGFIKYTDEGKDDRIFVHKSRLDKSITTLQKGQSVIFRIGHGMQGPQAIDVKINE